ncbi:MAG: flagellar hook-length control protein FliK [Ilumatobacteraceae bacterium]
MSTIDITATTRSTGTTRAGASSATSGWSDGSTAAHDPFAAHFERALSHDGPTDRVADRSHDRRRDDRPVGDDRSDRADRSDRSDRPDRPDRSDRSGHAARPERRDRAAGHVDDRRRPERRDDPQPSTTAADALADAPAEHDAADEPADAAATVATTVAAASIVAVTAAAESVTPAVPDGASSGDAAAAAVSAIGTATDAPAGALRPSSPAGADPTPAVAGGTDLAAGADADADAVTPGASVSVAEAASATTSRAGGDAFTSGTAESAEAQAITGAEQELASTASPTAGDPTATPVGDPEPEQGIDRGGDQGGGTNATGTGTSGTTMPSGPAVASRAAGSAQRIAADRTGGTAAGHAAPSPTTIASTAVAASPGGDESSRAAEPTRSPGAPSATPSIGSAPAADTRIVDEAIAPTEIASGEATARSDRRSADVPLMRTPGLDRITVDLSDEGLGPLTVQAVNGAGGLHVRLQAGERGVAEALAGAADQLRDDLEAGGTRLGSLDIGHRDPRSGGGAHRYTPDRRTSLTTEPAAAAVAATSTTRPSLTPSAHGLDVRI